MERSTNGVTPQSVSFSRGWGDARLWFSPLTDYAVGEAFTGLNPGYLNHSACAQVSSFYIGGINQGNDSPPCPWISAGSETKASKWGWATCNTLVEVYTYHSLLRGAYFNSASDYEMARECN